MIDLLWSALALLGAVVGAVLWGQRRGRQKAEEAAVDAAERAQEARSDVEAMDPYARGRRLDRWMRDE